MFMMAIVPHWTPSPISGKVWRVFDWYGPFESVADAQKCYNEQMDRKRELNRKFSNPLGEPDEQGLVIPIETIFGADKVVCPDCNGAGRFREGYFQNQEDYVLTGYSPCGRCNSRGLLGPALTPQVPTGSAQRLNIFDKEV